MIKSDGEVEVLPDIATFYIELSCLDKSIKVSKDCLVEKSNELISKLHSFGIDKKDIVTTSVNLTKSYNWIDNSRVFDGYHSSTSVFVTVKKIDRLEEIYSDLLENSNLNLGGLNYSHSKLDSLKNEAYLNALSKADILSDKLLEKLPESKKEILKIGNIEIAASTPEINTPTIKEKVLSDGYGGSSIAISKGTIKVNATLFVEYQIH